MVKNADMGSLSGLMDHTTKVAMCRGKEMAKESSTILKTKLKAEVFGKMVHCRDKGSTFREEKFTNAFGVMENLLP